MAKYKVEIAGSQSPIYREGFTIYRVNSNQDYLNQRKKRCLFLTLTQIFSMRIFDCR